MKFCIVFSIIIFICSCIFARKNTVDRNAVSNNDSLFSVYKIDSINNYYLVYLEKNENKYKIVSKKTHSKGKKIEINDKHYFNMRSLTYKYWFRDRELFYGEYVTCFTFEENTVICKEGNEINALYETKNLDGLNYISKK